MSGRAVGVDVGGTFTDLVSVGADGRITIVKLPSTPHDQSEGVAAALGRTAGETVERFVHGTTVATNMLLERTGARVLLLATEGFTDLLFLARQDRASLYDLTRHHPAPLVTRADVIPVRERLVPEGVHLPLDDAAIDDVVRELARRDPEIVVVALLHAYADPSHEMRLAAAIRAALPRVEVILSSEVFPEIREYERTATAVAEGYLRPGVSGYLTRLTARAAALGLPAPGVMSSGGGMRTVGEASANAASLALSGPAGGIVGAAAALRAAGLTDGLTVDIGGTSADVGLILDGEPLVEPGGRIAGVPIALPRVLVETVSAGGGSLGWIDDGGALRVGPRSAGAVPGPAAFGRGGASATVTDAHVVLGHITADQMSGGIVLDREAAHAAVAELAARLGASPARTALAMVDIADAAIARALRRVSVDRGIDPRGCVLVPFGGGGPLHACGLAEQLGMTVIFVPPHAGVLSALGLAIAVEQRERSISLTCCTSELDVSAVRRIRAGARGTLRASEGGEERWTVRARFRGQGHELDVPLEADDDGDAIAQRFSALHRRRNGFALEAAVELIGARFVARGGAPPFHLAAGAAGHRDGAPAGEPPSGQPTVVHGSTVIALPGATLRVKEGWGAVSHPTGGWTLTREKGTR